MRNSIRLFLLLVFLIPLTTCAIQKIDLRDVTGKQLPDPSYTFFDTQNKGYSVTFYCAAMKGSKDLDGSIQYQPVFLPIIQNNKLIISEYQKVVLVIEIWNQQLRPYEIIEVSKVTTNITEIRNYKRVVLSKSQYRDLQIELPFNETIKKVEIMLEFYDDEGNLLFRIGDFRYTIKEKEGDKE